MKDARCTNGGTLLGYARVWKGDEWNNVPQTKALKAAGCGRLFEEAISGGRWDRPRVASDVGPTVRGHTVAVWKLNRLSRPLKDVRHIMERISNAGAGFRSITVSVDTATPAERMIMRMPSRPDTWPKEQRDQFNTPVANSKPCAV